MAKLLVKKQDHSGQPPFDEQLWPVNVALVMLGGYLMGAVVIFLPRDNPWYIHPLTWFFAVPVLIGATMWILRSFDNKVLRRAIQLSAILSIIAHMTLLMFFYFMGMLPVAEVAKTEEDKQKPDKKVAVQPKLPETVWQRPTTRPTRQDFEKPIETTTPEPEQKEVQREENKPSERDPEPIPPQPLAVAKPEPTPQPALERAKEPEVPTPRAAPTQSLLSRNMNRTEAKPIPKEVQVAGAETKQPDPRQVAGSTATAQRQVTEPVKTPVPTAETNPTTTKTEAKVELSQRAETPPMQPTAQASATPRLERKIAQPTEAPRTNVQVAAVTAKPLETKPDQPRPDVVAATKQSPVAPEVARNVPSPTPTQTASAVPQPAERSEQTPRPTPNPPKPGPQIARTNPNERPTPMQTLAANQPATQTRESPAKVDARDTPIERTIVKVEARPPPTNPQLVEAPQPTPSPTPARATPSPTPTAQPTPNPSTVARATSTTQPTPATSVAQANPQPNPAATATTTPQASATTVQRTQPSMAPAVVQAPSVPVPNIPTELVRPSTATQRAEAEPTPAATTHPTPQPSAVARATPTTQPRNPTEAASVNTPAATTQAAPNPAAVAAQAAAITKSQAEVRISAQANQATAPTTAASTPNPATSQTVARAAQPQPTQVVQSTPTPNLQRQTEAAALRPTTSAVAQQVNAAQTGAASSESPGPTAVVATKEAGTAAAPSSRVADPSPMTPSEVKPETVARAQPGEAQPTMAQTPTPSPSAQRSVTETRPTIATIAAADPSPTRSPSPSASAEPRAAETSVARQSNPAPTANPLAGAPATNPVESPTTQLARTTATRAAPSPLPSVTPDMVASSTPLRSARVSSLETSPAPIESPALAESTRSTERPAAEPTRMALSKSTAGVAGIGESSNYDRSTPAPASPAQVASAAAKRSEATQATQPGPAISPSQSALVSRSRAGEQMPKSTLLATVDAANAAGGSSQPSDITASSSAALTRNSAAAKPADVSGAVGEMEVDTGTVQIVSAAGAGRAEGGGQPAMNLETNARAIARSQTGGAPQVTITATAPGETTTRPATGGGAPVAIDASPDANSLVKASAGGPAPVTGSPNTADLAGKPADAGAAEVVAAVEAGRAVPLNTSAGAPTPGGGTSSPARTATGQSLAVQSSVPVPALAGGATPAGGPANPGSSGSPTESSSAAVARTENGGVPSVGGPSVAPEVGAPAETRSVASTTGGRAASGEAAPSASVPAVSSSPLARAPGGVATLAANTRAAEIVVGSPPMGGAPGGAPAMEAGPQSTAVAKASSGGGQPVAAGLASTQPEAVGPTGSAAGGDVVASTEQGRAAQTSAASGAPALAAGSGSPTRAATSQPFSARATAQTIELAGGPMPGGAPASAGVPGGIPLDATGVEATRGAAAVPGSVAAPGGADAGPAPVQGLAGAEPGAVLGPRGTASDENAGPIPFTGINSGAPLKRADLAGVPAFGPSGPIAVNVPPAGPMTAARNDGTPDMEKIAGVVDAGPPERAASGAIPVALEVPEGPGGLGSEVTPDIGVAGRQADRDSRAISFVPSRFTRQTLGGTPGTSPTAIVAAEAFAQRRTSGLRRRGDEPGGDVGRPPRATEDAIELGLFFLSQHQMSDGSWSLTRYMANRPGYAREATPTLASDTAATGLSLLCFFGAGYHHQDDKYQQQIKRAIDWLVEHQKPDGDLYVPMDATSNRSNQLYSHAIATIALCEAYGMTQDPALKEPAQKALDFIIAAQHKTHGGWRYAPGQESDTSVTGWMVMALKSGELAKLKVPPEVYDKVRHWLDEARGGPGQEHLFRYNPNAPDTELQRAGRKPTKTMTAVGLLVAMYTGKNRDDPRMKAGADYLFANLPAIGDLRNVQRDTYYWYYATQVMYHMKGDYWKQWNQKLHPILVTSQVRQGPTAGSWDPLYPVPDKWGPHAGRLYVTTLNLLSLEVQYRHLPIYEETAK